MYTSLLVFVNTSFTIHQHIAKDPFLKTSLLSTSHIQMDIIHIL